MYLGDFASKEDIASNFSIDLSVLENAKVLFAAYSNENYEGYAMVIYAQGGKLYEVHGSHCSCMGLEDQWSPEETSVDALKVRNYSHGSMQYDLSKFLVDFIFEEDVLKN